MTSHLARFVRDLRQKADTPHVPQTVEDRFAEFANEPVGFERDVLRIERLLEYRSACMIPGLVPRAGLGNRGVGPTRCEPGVYQPTGPQWGRFPSRPTKRAGEADLLVLWETG
jgi:hypothetical protein